MVGERSSEELSELVVVDTLEKRKRELEEVVIPQMLRDANKPVYAAKEQAEKIIADANAEAKKIKEEADKLIPRAQEKAAILEQEASTFVLAAKKKDAEAAKIKEEVEKDRADFGAEKFAHETNLATKKSEAEALMNNALTLQTEQNTRKTNLDGRESVVIKKEQNYESKLLELESMRKSVEDKITELRAVEQSHADAKAEISALKSENEDILANIEKKKEEARLATEKSKKAQASLLEREKEIDEKIKTNGAHLKSISKEKAELKDEAKTLDEKQRMNKILERQLDEKIRTLKRLRQEDAGRSTPE